MPAKKETHHILQVFHQDGQLGFRVGDAELDLRTGACKNTQNICDICLCIAGKTEKTAKPVSNC